MSTKEKISREEFEKFIFDWMEINKVSPDEVFEVVINEDEEVFINLPEALYDKFLNKFPGVSIEETLVEFVKKIIDKNDSLKV